MTHCHLACPAFGMYMPYPLIRSDAFAALQSHNRMAMLDDGIVSVYHRDDGIKIAL